MKFREVDGLPIGAISIDHAGIGLDFPGALIDSGSAGTLFPSDVLKRYGIVPSANSTVRDMVGIGGGVEQVFEFEVDSVAIGNLKAENFLIQMGKSDYGFGFNVIVGFDFLKAVGAVLDFGRMEIRRE